MSGPNPTSTLVFQDLFGRLLELEDANPLVSLFDYRRIVIDVTQDKCFYGAAIT